MALKAKNKRKQQQKDQVSGNKELTKSKSWLNLPNQLEHHPNLDNRISFGGITKSWRTSPKHCNSKLPWLQLTNTQNYRIHNHNITARRASIQASFSYMPSGCWCRYFLRKISRYPWKHYVGCSNGILIAEAEPFYLYYLWNPTHREMFRLPLWDHNVPLKVAVLSSRPEDPNCTVMVLTGISQPAFAFYKLKRLSNISWETPDQAQWTMQDCTFTETLGKQQQVMQFTNAIGFKGKFYALSMQGSLVVIENIDGVFKIMDSSATRIVPSVSSNHLREYLLESGGEILLVFLVSRKSSVHNVDGVEVYQLNMDRLSWIELETLGERAVFVGSNCSVSVLANEVGCRRNCIYFKHPVADEWCVCDMESRNLSQGWSEANPATSAIWFEQLEE